MYSIWTSGRPNKYVLDTTAAGPTNSKVLRCTREGAFLDRANVLGKPGYLPWLSCSVCVGAKSRRSYKNQIIVTFRAGTDRGEREQVRDAVDAKVLDGAKDFPLLQLLSAKEDVSTSEMLLELRRRPEVKTAARNAITEPDVAVNDKYFSYQWGFQNTGQDLPDPFENRHALSEPLVPGADISLPQAWDKSTGSKDTIVAVVDSGVDFSHPDLVGRAWEKPGEPGAHGWDLRFSFAQRCSC